MIGVNNNHNKQTERDETNMANEEVKKAIRKHGIYHYQIADVMGLQDSAFSKLLRKELPDEKKKEIYAAITRLTGVKVVEAE